MYRLPTQKIMNVKEGDDTPTPAVSEAAQTQFIGGAYLRRDNNNNWFVTETVKTSELVEQGGGAPDLRRDTFESGAERRLSKNYYDPPFVCRGPTTNDTDTNGGRIEIDLPQFTKMRVRIYAGLDRPIQITRVYLDNRTGVSTITLWK